jgi:DNA-binding NarL/FixJ family response regulator
MKITHVLVADDHAVVRKGLRSMLESHPGWEVSAEATNGREAVALSLEHKPDIVVMDINMPELNGLEATRQICKALPETRVLILSAHDSEQLVREMLVSGARGYVLKADAGEDLIAAVEALTVGRLFFTSSVSEFVMRGLRTGEEGGKFPELPPRLSPREREVIQLLAEGKTNKEVAARLDISVKTAETHRKHIMDKLDLHSLSDLVRYAIQNGIISP